MLTFLAEVARLVSILLHHFHSFLQEFIYLVLLFFSCCSVVEDAVLILTFYDELIQVSIAG